MQIGAEVSNRDKKSSNRGREYKSGKERLTNRGREFKSGQILQIGAEQQLCWSFFTIIVNGFWSWTFFAKKLHYRCLIEQEQRVHHFLAKKPRSFRCKMLNVTKTFLKIFFYHEKIHLGFSSNFVVWFVSKSWIQ